MSSLKIGSSLEKSDNLLIILCKAPFPGNVKSRLAKSIGSKNASELMKSMLIDMLSELTCPDYDLIICAPERDRGYKVFFEDIVGDIDLCFHGGGNLRGKSSQLYKLFEEKTRNHKKVIAVNADTPFLTKEIVNNSFFKLNENEVVLGPDQGDGYYLVGMKDFIDIFSKLPNTRVPYLHLTFDLLNQNHIKYTLVEQLRDIDFLEDIYEINWKIIVEKKSLWTETYRKLTSFGLILNGTS